MNLNQFNKEVKKLQPQVDKKILTVENETKATTEFIEENCLTYKELEELITINVRSNIKEARIKAELAAGSPIAVITDDDIKKGSFIRIYPADQKTRENLLNYCDGHNIQIIGHQCLILLNSDVFINEGNSILDLNFNLLYKVLESTTSDKEGFIHTTMAMGEVIE